VQDEMDETCSLYGNYEKSYKMLVGEPQRKSSCGRHRHWCINNTNTGIFVEIDGDSVV